MGHLAEIDSPQIAHARPLVAGGFPRMEDELLDGAGSIRTNPSPIETQTPIVPRAVAEAVWEEASVWLDEPLPRAWIPALTRRADAIFKHNRQFRQLILREGNAGLGLALGFYASLAGWLGVETPPSSPRAAAGLLQRRASAAIEGG